MSEKKNSTPSQKSAIYVIGINDLEDSHYGKEEYRDTEEYRDGEEEDKKSGKKLMEVVSNFVNADILKENLYQFAYTMNTLIDELPQPTQFQLDTIEFQLNVSASGKVGFLGCGVGSQTTGGIRLILKKKKE